MELGWGRHYLMCPPDHFDVAYAINPWMVPETRVDRDRAREQWNDLRRVLEQAGATVDTLPARPGLPDMVFTANHAVVSGGRACLARLRHPERGPEPACARDALVGLGFDVVDLPLGVVQEGTGDALSMAGTVVAGVGPRGGPDAPGALARALGAEVLGARLVDARYYHVDLALCPLDDRRALVVPHAFHSEDSARVLGVVAEPLVLDDDEAVTFAANSVAVGRTVVMPACPVRVGRQLEAWGFDVVVVDVGEFAKAGGAVRCMTLPLDVELAVVPAAA